jgi:hypothetical protein
MLAIALSLALGSPQAPAPPQAPERAFAWVVTDRAPPGARLVKAPPAPKKPARRAKACCSPACTCGCQDGGPCRCASTTGAPVGTPACGGGLGWAGAPAFFPAPAFHAAPPTMASRPAPVTGGGFGGGFTGGGGGFRGGCAGGG